MTEKPAVDAKVRLSESLRRRRPGDRGRVVADFARLLHSRTDPSYFGEFTEEQLELAALSRFDIVEAHREDGFVIVVESPDWLVPKRGSGRSVITVTGPDQPFIVDTLRELVRVRGWSPVQLFHPILCLRRDERGQVIAVDKPAECEAGDDATLTSIVHLELDRTLTTEEQDDFRQEAEQAFALARSVARDFKPMLARLEEIIGHLAGHRLYLPEGATADESEVDEAIEFLRWLRRSNFVFLGYREYDIRPGEPEPSVAVARGSGLGILRDETASKLYEPLPVSKLSSDARERICGQRVLTVYKTPQESLVLRRTRMDYVGVKKYDRDGNICGERRFLGLFTARALEDLPSDIPVLRKKLDLILDELGIVSGSHDHKEIFSIFCSLPKSELFVNEVAALKELVLSVLEGRDRLDVRVSYRPDVLERGVSVMVLIPRDRFSSRARESIQELLSQRFQGSLVDYRLALTNEPQARMHFYFATPPGRVPAPPIAELQERIAALTRTWDELVLEALEAHTGVDDPQGLARRYKEAFPAGYRAQEPASVAVHDIIELERMRASGQPRVVVCPGRTRRRTEVTQIKILRPGGQFHLSTLMPILNHIGLEVWDELTYRIDAADAEGFDYIHSFRVLGPDGEAISDGEPSRRLEDCIRAVLFRHVVDDHLNSLVVRSELDWREVDVLRAYTWYLRQLEGALRQRTAYTALTKHPEAAVRLVRLFEARFDPSVTGEERDQRQRAESEALRLALEAVPGIAEDQILRAYENLIHATTRTNRFQTRDPSAAPPATALKIRCADVARMPLPRPLYEIFVAAPTVEGVHLRSGKVARGGIRWSDRVDDFRKEVLGLMKAQRTKNALIVPVGAKGGFVLRHAPAPERLAEEVRAQYEIFIRALLSVTDNVVDGRVVPPTDTVRHDEDDPYLVVAADRGTAQFSDVANEIARRSGFWLSDAFASGGSHGYNHKAYGITARGAWECVKRHFRERGVDTQRDVFSACGIGDMSGDVFGNGMLLSPKIRLLAAFNHRHVFVDPNPDPEISFEERERLFSLPRSSWSDYEAAKISAGGGVWERSAKAIRLSRETRDALRLEHESAVVNGDELVRAILRMPVDLLWNGGIGTYVRASTESDLDVGDPQNDAVRVDACQVRARVIGEGGNLGVTQAGRVEFARRGGAINTDFIDNSGGVDLSDREVNLKILLERAIAAGALEREERDSVLEGVANEVCEQVLADNRLQSVVLSLEETQGVERLDQVRMVIEDLEAEGLLHRSVEGVPEDPELSRLRESGMGLTRPQLAVLLAYVKIDAFARLMRSDLARSPLLTPFLDGYFPTAIRERFHDAIHDHPLRDEITLTVAVNTCVNRMGLTFLHRLCRETGSAMDRVLHAWIVADSTVEGDAFHRALDESYQSGAISPAIVHDAMSRHADSMERLCRWLLRRSRSRTELESLAGPRPTSSTITAADAATGKAGFPAPVQSLLERAASALDEWLARDLATRGERATEKAAAALSLASDRLLVSRVEEEADRVVRSDANDWQMCSALLEDLADLRERLAASILARAADRGDEVSSDDLLRAAESVLPELAPERRGLIARLDQLRAREPAPPSFLFVLVEDLRRLVDRPTAEPGPAGS